MKDEEISSQEQVFDKIHDLRFNYSQNEALEYALQFTEFHDVLMISYTMGELAVELDDYELAIKILSNLIDQSYIQENGWFLDCAYILRSYSYAKIGMVAEARSDMNQEIIQQDEHDDFVDVFWLMNHGNINTRTIEEILQTDSNLNQSTR